MFLKSVISQACSCVVTPVTAFVTTAPVIATNTINQLVTVLATNTQTVVQTSVSTVVVSDTVDQAVFQLIDSGLNCPGFGGSIVPITAVNTADIPGCIDACFRNTPSLLTIKPIVSFAENTQLAHLSRDIERTV